MQLVEPIFMANNPILPDATHVFEAEDVTQVLAGIQGDVEVLGEQCRMSELLVQLLYETALENQVLLSDRLGPTLRYTFFKSQYNARGIP